MIDLVVIEEEDLLDGKVRLDKLLTRKYPKHSRSYFQYLIENGLVLLNGKPVKKRVQPVVGDQVEIRFALTPEIDVIPEPIPLSILYEDEAVMAIDKPAGMVVHPGAGNPSGTVANGLLYHCRSLEVDAAQPFRPGIVHRLDKNTSGVLICAKTLAAQSALVEQFAARTTEKLYIAIAQGPVQETTIDAPIGRHPVHRQKMAVRAEGKPARTHLLPIAEAGGLTVVLIKLETGRTHQIRVHLAHQNTPIVGDGVYGRGGERQLLHAWQLTLAHPMTGEPLRLRAPLPEDIVKVLRKIRPQEDWNAAFSAASERGFGHS